MAASGVISLGIGSPSSVGLVTLFGLGQHIVVIVPPSDDRLVLVGARGGISILLDTRSIDILASAGAARIDVDYRVVAVGIRESIGISAGSRVTVIESRESALVAADRRTETIESRESARVRAETRLARVAEDRSEEL